MSSLKIEDFNILKVIGYGAYSTVLAGQYKNRTYAIKTVKKQNVSVTDLGVTEKTLLQIIKYPFIIQLLACFTSQSHICFLLEYAPGGDLKYYLKTRGCLTENDAAFYTAETALAIDFLHTKNIIHRDIKLQNILIAFDGHIKLTDFGAAKKLEKGERAKSLIGVVHQMAPEIITRDSYGHEVDWWSLGLALYTLLYGKPPLLPWDSFHLKNTEESKQEIEYPTNIPENAINILRRFLKKNPDERLGKAGISEIQSQIFFKDIDWGKLAEKSVKPPFIPTLESCTNFCHFDPQRIRDPISLDVSSLNDKQCSNDQEIYFKDFDYVNPEWNP